MVYFLYFLIGALFVASHDKIMDFDFTFWGNSAEMSWTWPGCGQAACPIVSVLKDESALKIVNNVAKKLKP